MERRSFLTGLVLGSAVLRLSGGVTTFVFTSNATNEALRRYYTTERSIVDRSPGDLWLVPSTEELKVFDGRNWTDLSNT